MEHDNFANGVNFYQQNPTTSIFGANPFTGRPVASHMMGSPNHVNESLDRYGRIVDEAIGK
jgi:hypothetical protein